MQPLKKMKVFLAKILLVSILMVGECYTDWVSDNWWRQFLLLCFASCTPKKWRRKGCLPPIMETKAGKYSATPTAGVPRGICGLWMLSLSRDKSKSWITCFRFIESTWTESNSNAFKFYFLWDVWVLFPISKCKVEQLYRRPRKLVSTQMTVVGDNLGKICP